MDTEKYLNDLRNYVLGLVPEEKNESFGFVGNDTDKIHRIGKQLGFNAAREEMIKRINEADFEPLIRT